MKNQTLLAVLAVAAVYVSAAVVDPVAVVDPESVAIVDHEVELGVAADSRNLNVGAVATGNKLLHRNYYQKFPIANAVQSQDITYRGNSSTRITAIQVNEIGYTQFATARITSGGLNRNTVTIRLTSARSYGYYFLVSIYGR